MYVDGADQRGVGRDEHVIGNRWGGALKGQVVRVQRFAPVLVRDSYASAIVSEADVGAPSEGVQAGVLDGYRTTTH